VTAPLVTICSMNMHQHESCYFLDPYPLSVLATGLTHPDYLSMIILLIAAVGILVHKEESEAKVKTGRLKEQMWFVEERQEKN